jgi:hypothetical protein
MTIVGVRASVLTIKGLLKRRRLQTGMKPLPP